MKHLPPRPDMAQLDDVTGAADDDPREGMGAALWALIGILIWVAFCAWLVARAFA